MEHIRTYKWVITNESLVIALLVQHKSKRGAGLYKGEHVFTGWNSTYCQNVRRSHRYLLSLLCFYLLVFLLPPRCARAVAQGWKQRIQNPRPIWRHHQDLRSPNLQHQEKCPLVLIAAAPMGGMEGKGVIWTHG